MPTIAYRCNFETFQYKDRYVGSLTPGAVNPFFTSLNTYLPPGFTYTGPNAELESEPKMRGAPQLWPYDAQNLRTLKIPPIPGASQITGINVGWAARTVINYRVENTHASHTGDFSVGSTQCLFGLHFLSSGDVEFTKTATIAASSTKTLAVYDGQTNFAGASGSILSVQGTVASRVSTIAEEANPGQGIQTFGQNGVYTLQSFQGNPGSTIDFHPFVMVLPGTKTWTAAGGSISGDLTMEDWLYATGKFTLAISYT